MHVFTHSFDYIALSGLAQLGYEVNASRAGRANNCNFHHDGRGSKVECLAVRPVTSTASDGM